MSNSAEDLAVGTGVILLQDQEVDVLWSRISGQQKDVETTTLGLKAIAIKFFERVKNRKEVEMHTLVPVYVLRGGLLLRDGFDEVFSVRPAGVVLMDRDSALDPPKVRYGNVPRPFVGSVYILIDLIMATGATIVAAMSSLSAKIPQVDSREVKVVIACPFMTRRAIGAVNSRFPGTLMYAFWPNMTVDPEGRIVELEFDAGDYALGGSRQRIVW